MGGMGGWDAGMQNEESSKETVGEWGDYLPYTWSQAFGSYEGGIGQRGSREYEAAAREIMVERKIDQKNGLLIDEKAYARDA